MKTRRSVFLFLSIFVVFACNLPSNQPGANPADTATPTTASSVAVLSTSTNTPVGSTVPFASPSGQPLNCRTGPDTSWPVLIVLNPGQNAEIVGKNSNATWWYVKNPFQPGTFCWISMSFSTTTGDVSTVQVVAVPPTSAAPTNTPGSSAGTITSVEVSLSKDTIHVPGCIGPIQPITVYAKIQSNGAIKINWHFNDEQSGNLSSHSLNFKKADIQDISESFTPKLNASEWRVKLVIDGVNLQGKHASASYTVTC